MNVTKLMTLTLAVYFSFVHIVAAQDKSIKTEIIEQDGGYTLLRDGKPYFIKGAGGTRYMDRLKEYGGNSIRTWGTNNAQQILDEAQRLGLTVTMGINMARERHGFDYDDAAAVAEQLARFARKS